MHVDLWFLSIDRGENFLEEATLMPATPTNSPSRELTRRRRASLFSER